MTEISGTPADVEPGQLNESRSAHASEDVTPTFIVTYYRKRA
jgi:hypothetical protein